MNKIEIEVPKEVRYISEWNDFPKEQLSTGHCIVNKVITGCGYTHNCLTDKSPTILCSPRKVLLENKHRQLPNTYLVINSVEKEVFLDQDIDNSKQKMTLTPASPDNFDGLSELKSEIVSYINQCFFSNQPPKILVTYDSLKHVLSVVNPSLFTIIVDEFQNIFNDARFKAETELSFLSYLQSCPNVTYVSATPYIEEYLNELDEFKSLPYYEFKWNDDSIKKATIIGKQTKNPYKEVSAIIEQYRLGTVPPKILEDRSIHYSNEVVFYVNNVKMIGTIIKKNNLKPEEVNIICSKDKKNVDRLKSLGHSIGEPPLKGEPHKMFTFCTRTVYSGADFYSTSAKTVIISDCNLDCLSVDIRMDLPQILGRQRLKENVFRDEALFIYKLSDKDITMEQFKIIEKKKQSKTQMDIQLSLKTMECDNPSLARESYLSSVRAKIAMNKYTLDYTGIDERTGEIKENKLIRISEKRAFELRSSVYKDNISLYNEFSEGKFKTEKDENIELTKDLENLFSIISLSNDFYKNMKSICEFLFKWSPKGVTVRSLVIDSTYKNYINYLGIEKIRALGYSEIDLKREIHSLQKEDMIKEIIIEKFRIGEKYLLNEIKIELKNLYDFLGVHKSAKASNLLNYFNIKETKIYDPITKKQSKGYLILSLKE